jgi:hypothetical protein
MVRYFGEPDPVYVGEDKEAKSKVSAYGQELPEKTKPGMECLGEVSLGSPGVAWGAVQGFGASSPMNGIPFGLGEQSNCGFGPGGVANPDFCSYGGKAVASSTKSTLQQGAPTPDSLFLETSNMPRV